MKRFTFYVIWKDGNNGLKETSVVHYEQDQAAAFAMHLAELSRKGVQFVSGKVPVVQRRAVIRHIAKRHADWLGIKL